MTSGRFLTRRPGPCQPAPDELRKPMQVIKLLQIVEDPVPIYGHIAMYQDISEPGDWSQFTGKVDR